MLNIAITYTVNAVTYKEYYRDVQDSQDNNTMYLPLQIIWLITSEELLPTLAYLVSLMFSFKKDLKPPVVMISTQPDNDYSVGTTSGEYSFRATKYTKVDPSGQQEPNMPLIIQKRFAPSDELAFYRLTKRTSLNSDY